MRTLHKLRSELREIANHIERDYPETAHEVREIGNELAEHAREDAASIGEDADEAVSSFGLQLEFFGTADEAAQASFAAGDGGGD